MLSIVECLQIRREGNEKRCGRKEKSLQQEAIDIQKSSTGIYNQRARLHVATTPLSVDRQGKMEMRKGMENFRAGSWNLRQIYLGYLTGYIGIRMKMKMKKLSVRPGR